ncbi:MAG TPA: DMT family transporter [Candidatus Acutalibacter stercoravium]|nr:DMT family transporter [Candidatus Acutalibacter stercoravium]
MGNETKQLRGGAMLMLTALIWGTAFVAQSVGMDYLGPCAFTATRNFIGCVALLPVIALASRLRSGAQPEEAAPAPGKKALFGWGAACGLLLGGATLLQQAGMQTASAGKAGFLTALYIVIVPVLGIFLGRRPGLKVWMGVVLALVGAYLLSVKGGAGIASGDLLVIASAVVFSLHILVIDSVPAGVDGVRLSCVQFLVAGVFALVLALFLESFTWRDILSAWVPLLYTGVVSSGVGYTLQILGQRTVNPTVASLILSLESVFAALAGWAILGQALSLRELFGCALVFVAVILAQLPSKKGRAINGKG